jgi:hypothetical protein
MTDLLGALAIPIPVPAAGKTVADPFLDYLGDFLQAAINADAKAAWTAVHPAVVKPHSVPLPVAFVKRHNPNEADFRSGDLPALFVYRASTGKRTRIGPEWTLVPTTIHILWVPPRAQQKHLSLRQSYRHAVEAAIERCLQTGRDPAWVVAGDSDPSAATAGSHFFSYAKLFELPTILDSRDHVLKIPSNDGAGDGRQRDTVDEFDAFLVTMEIHEVLAPDPLRRAVPLRDTRGSILLGSDPDALLATLPFQLSMTVDAIEPVTGLAAGNTEVTLIGKQFVEVMEVYFGTTLARAFTFVDESTVTVRTPAHAVGLVDVGVRSPSDEVTLEDAFTFTSL